MSAYDDWLEGPATAGVPSQVEDAYDEYVASLEDGVEPMTFGDFFSDWCEEQEYEHQYRLAERRHPDARI